MHSRAGTKADYAAQNCRARVFSFSEQLDDRFMERLALVLVALTDVNAHQNSLACEAVHFCSLTPHTQRDHFTRDNEPAKGRDQRESNAQRHIESGSLVLTFLDECRCFEAVGGKS